MTGEPRQPIRLRVLRVVQTCPGLSAAQAAERAGRYSAAAVNRDLIHLTDLGRVRPRREAREDAAVLVYDPQEVTP